MKQTRPRPSLFLWTLVLSSVFSSLPVSSWCMDPVDHGPYEELLEAYVKEGVVDYQGFKNEEKRLDAYLRLLEKTDTGKLPLDEQLAFYINTYNAATIKLILSRYPDVKSIKDLGSFFRSPFKEKIVHIEGETMSLDDLEHGIIRARFKDPRVHFAVNCASKSCPPLISQPYWGSTLDEQLNASTRHFINNPERNYLDGKTLYVSKIFKWFSEDFDDNVLGFFLKYAEGDFKERLVANKFDIEVEYLDYDWSLNGR